MKILVTGAMGFVGRHVINELLKYNHQVIAATRKVDLKSNGDKLEYTFLDIDNPDLTQNYFAQLGSPDLLIHLAWQGLPNYKSLFHFEDNLMAHYSFLKNMVMNGLNNVVVTGTCFEYGMREGCLSEDMIPDPQNAYALAKDTLRKFLFELKKKYPFDCKWIRLFYMYGEGQNPSSLLSQLQTALQKGDKEFNMSGGEQERDYLPVEKVAEYIVSIALQNTISGIINCCSGKPMKVKQLVENYLKDNKQEIKLNLGYYPYTDYEAMSFWGDDAKLKKIINERSYPGI
ncbi:NAD(P)-dependent oxidoreductase [Ginsengibacter hankyongi]|uniref:NAD(P)-dependent oxidoreductase n=1 Tax=Ginsengibacter hankyongi TaxID=2607284 RepID=A0A5J5IIZ4_9BACT|nr:NAD(P)-dependent oxidoreductase [Ginsengibacter hankyongi]KAA9041015.1 NAD(P)-dependent oxidoreductase [Ginsengibacter hankyongi]